jgi:UDP-GlcNAc3NAcA epimerase
MLNLKNEGFDNFDTKIVKSGDVMQDGAMFYRDYAIKPKIKIDKDYILSTVHRAENTDNPERLQSIFEALKQISLTKQVILPLHPRTKKIVQQLQFDISGITIIDPVGYLEMVWLIDHCSLVMTDSGGLQKEAFFFEKHCMTLRDETEWVELVENRFNVLVGADKDKIINTYNSFVFADDYKINLYGEGKASACIVSKLLEE